MAKLKTFERDLKEVSFEYYEEMLEIVPPIMQGKEVVDSLDKAFGNDGFIKGEAVETLNSGNGIYKAFINDNGKTYYFGLIEVEENISESKGKNRYEKMKAIVDNRAYSRVEGVAVDMQSANLFIQIYDTLIGKVLNGENVEKAKEKLEKFDNDDLNKVLQFCWYVAS